MIEASDFLLPVRVFRPPLCVAVWVGIRTEKEEEGDGGEGEKKKKKKKHLARAERRRLYATLPLSLPSLRAPHTRADSLCYGRLSFSIMSLTNCNQGKRIVRTRDDVFFFFNSYAGLIFSTLGILP